MFEKYQNPPTASSRYLLQTPAAFSTLTDRREPRRTRGPPPTPSPPGCAGESWQRRGDSWRERRFPGLAIALAGHWTQHLNLSPKPFPTGACPHFPLFIRGALKIVQAGSKAQRPCGGACTYHFLYLTNLYLRAPLQERLRNLHAPILSLHSAQTWASPPRNGQGDPGDGR